MKPISFKEQNIVFVKPGDMTDEECGSLPAFKNGAINISCWKLSLKERLKALFTGVIWMDILSDRQPPVWIGVDNPFKGEDENE